MQTVSRPCGAHVVVRRVDGLEPHFGRAKVISCWYHGTSAWCYIQPDGSHVDADACRCSLSPSPDCPVDGHREAALRASRANPNRN